MGKKRKGIDRFKRSPVYEAPQHFGMHVKVVHGPKGYEVMEREYMEDPWTVTEEHTKRKLALARGYWLEKGWRSRR